MNSTSLSSRIQKPTHWSPNRVLVGAGLALGTFMIVRAAMRARRELAAYRENAAKLQSEWTTIAGVAGANALRVHARVARSAYANVPPVVMVHGYGRSSRHFVPLAGRLAGDADVFAPDLPGHGESDHHAYPLTVPELAQALAAWMGARELPAAVLVGHAIGCQVAVELAVRRPELVAGIVLISPSADPAARSERQQFARVLASTVLERPTYTAWRARDDRQAGTQVLADEMKQMLAHHLEDNLPRLTVPVRVVRGERDRFATVAWVNSVARLAGAPPPNTIPEWGHAVHYDAPGAVARIVRRFARTLAEIGPAPGDNAERVLDPALDDDQAT